MVKASRLRRGAKGLCVGPQDTTFKRGHGYSLEFAFDKKGSAQEKNKSRGQETPEKIKGAFSDFCRKRPRGVYNF